MSRWPRPKGDIAAALTGAAVIDLRVFGSGLRD